MRSLILFFLVMLSIEARGEVFTLLIYEPEKSFTLRTDAKSSYWQDFSNFAGDMQKAGILRGGTAFLAGNSAQYVEVGTKGSKVKKGVFGQNKDILSGYLSIDVENMGQALEWARKAPGQYGLKVEIRPSQANPTMKMQK